LGTKRAKFSEALELLRVYALEFMGFRLYRLRCLWF
jgi:hypothetical protein